MKIRRNKKKSANNGKHESRHSNISGKIVSEEVRS